MFKAAIIGCGMVHVMHAEALINGEDTCLAAVADIIPERARKAEEEYGCDWYSDYKPLLERPDIDSVHICTPHYLHAPIAIAAMRAGKHVFTEKPMAIKPSDARDMIAVSKQTGKTLGVCFQNRYNKINSSVKALLDSRKPGKILGARAIVTWHRDRDYYNCAEWRGTWAQEGGGVLINQSIHTIDMLQWYLGGIEKLKGNVDTRLLGDCIEVEDTAEATAISRGGVAALLYATNCYSSTPNPLVEIECEKAVIRVEDEVRVKWSDGRTENIYDDDGKGVGDKAYWGRSHSVIIRDFYRSIAAGEQFAVDGDQGIEAIKFIDAIYRSSANGEYVTL